MVAQFRIGELLVRKKLISQADLEQVLAEQKVSGKKLGEILLHKDLISYVELQGVLLEQHWRKTGFWVID